MQQSLHHFWDSIIHPVLQASSARNIVEIGCADGVHTKDLLAYCKEHQGHLDVIDPEPDFHIETFLDTYGPLLEIHLDLSVNALPKLSGYDTVVIDGDHNWYTVYNELKLIEKHCKNAAGFPVIIFHDTGWPYARRDMYCNPETIPEAHRKQWVEKGILPGVGTPVEEQGFNEHCLHAIEEHNFCNGVLTAIEDFIAESSHKYSLVSVPGFFGISILTSSQRQAKHPLLVELLQHLGASENIDNHMNALERARIDTQIALNSSNRQKEFFSQLVHRLRENVQHLQKQKADITLHAKSLAETCASAEEYVSSLQEAIEQKEQDSIALAVHHEQQLHTLKSTLSWKAAGPLRYLEQRYAHWKYDKLAAGHNVTAEQASEPEPDITTPKPLVGCTIIAKNYLAQARVLAQSFLEHHPDSTFYVLLVDELDDAFDPATEQFSLVTIDQLELPKKHQLCFQYTCRELSTAVKPAFLSHLLRTTELETIVYLDPDTAVFSSMDTLVDTLQSNNIALTPHILQPITDASIHPNETELLQVGTANLGFIGLRRSAITFQFLDWWNTRLIDHAFEDLGQGMFFDQKWLDIASSFFEDIAIIRDPGYNVAFWNLQERTIHKRSGQYTVNGSPLVLYHFSGYRPELPDQICHYPLSTHSFKQYPSVRVLHDSYAKKLYAADYKAASALPYAFGVFSNGTPIAPCIRRTFYELQDKRSRWSNPFSVEDSGCFFDWLNATAKEMSANTYLSNLHVALYTSRQDLQVRFPTLNRSAAISIGLWLLQEQQRRTYALDDAFLASLENVEQSQPHTPIWKRVFRKRNSFKLYRLGVRIAKCLLPRQVQQRARTRFSIADLPEDPGQQTIVMPSGPVPDVTIAGYVTSENGVGEATRATIRSLDAASISYQLYDVVHTPARRNEETYTSACKDQQELHVSPITIAHVNADQVAVLQNDLREDLFSKTYSIGYWYWELSQFPAQWSSAFNAFDEIWVASTFCKETIQAATDLPVVCMPPSIEAPEYSGYRKSHFGVAEDDRMFLFICDFLSIAERKNPLGIVEAFTQAFSQDDNAMLYIKCIHTDSNPAYMRALEEATKDIRCCMNTSYLEKEEIADLLHCCDAYVSLHRSEGFGINMAEAMAIGKPVIATNYSGNADFMDPEHSYPVPYALKTLDQDYGPYTKGNVWADPDIEEAAAAMRDIYLHPNTARQKGYKASQFIATAYNAQRIGQEMHLHFQEIRSTEDGGLTQ